MVESCGTVSSDWAGLDWAKQQRLVCVDDSERTYDPVNGDYVDAADCGIVEDLPTTPNGDQIGAQCPEQYA